MGFQLPSANSRVSICGMTGSGKSQFALWLFSFSEFRKRPYVIVDFKRDATIGQIPHLREISLHQIPTHPGLYVLRPTPGEDAAMSEWLKKVWQRGNIGLLFDEAYMINKFDRWFNAILTQGRSLNIPCMILTQRPTYCSRFIFSEANFFAVFRLNDKRDFETVRNYIPASPVFDFATPLQEYCARWYDAGQREAFVIDPVPDEADLLQKYRDLLGVKLRRL